MKDVKNVDGHKNQSQLFLEFSLREEMKSKQGINARPQMLSLVDKESHVTHYIFFLSSALRDLKGKVCAHLKYRPSPLAFLYNSLSYMAFSPVVLWSCCCKCNFCCIRLHIIFGRSPCMSK